MYLERFNADPHEYAMARFDAPIDDFYFCVLREQLADSADNIVLVDQVVDHDATAGDILNLR